MMNGTRDQNDRTTADFEDDPTAGRITETLVRHVRTIAEESGAAAVFVYIDALQGEWLPSGDGAGPRVFYVTKSASEDLEPSRCGAQFLQVPDVPLTRMAQVKVALFLAASRGLIQPRDVVVCLTGIPESGTLDTLIVMQAGHEIEMFSTDDGPLPPQIRVEVIDRIVDLASQLGSEGREGKPVGALFVIGDIERVTLLSRQLILNPFRGYPESERNVLDPGLAETIREFSTIDGAFLIRGDGVIETCGALLKISEQQHYELPRGLGTRHHAAAAITAVTDSVAVSVSESTGTVTVFRGGRIMTELEHPRNLGRVSKLSARLQSHARGEVSLDGNPSGGPLERQSD